MDDPAIDPVAHRRALRGLARLNRLSLSSRPVWNAMRARLSPGAREVRVCDVASGSGDGLVSIGLRLRRAGYTPVLTACDCSPMACETTRARGGAHGLDIDAHEIDALAEELPGAHDFVICSLFVHHLTDADATGLLRLMARACRCAVIVSDLRRSRAGLALAVGVPRFVTRSAIVHTDAVRSVRAACTPEELRTLAQRAGLDEVSIQTVFPQRILLVWDNPR